MLGLYSVHGAAGAVFYVDDDADLGGDGSSWETAYKYLQDALYDSALTGGDTIRVAAGTYTPDKDEGGNVTHTDRTATFQLVNGVELYGGYAGVPGPNPDKRDPNTYVSILSGDLAGEDEPNFVNYSENSYHVVNGSNTDSTAVLDGFTISSGNANGDETNRLGGGMFNDNGSPVVTNCSFTKNTTTDFGGGMYNYYSSPTVTNCIFKDNHSGDYGGGIENDFYCSPMVTACTFSNNTAPNGGGIDNFINCNPTVIDCTFNNNSATIGAGMANWGSNPTVTECIFTGNSATDSGGGLYDNDSSPTVTNCIINDNIATLDGGGMYNYRDASPILTNCTFSGNVSGQYGGGIYNHGDSSPVIVSCILWGDTAPLGAEIYNHDVTSVPAVNYSDVQGGWEGTGNLDSDPRFADPENGDFHLKSKAGRWVPATRSWILDPVTSPAIDRGDPAGAWSNEPSPNGGRINLGVYGGTTEASKSDMTVTNYHPADYPSIDMRLIINELTAYGSSWKTGQEWPVEPNPIPINYLTRAGYLWKGGEIYHYDSQENPPLCWEPGDNNPQFSFAKLDNKPVYFLFADGQATINRSFDPDSYTPEQPVTVYIQIVPTGGTLVYAVEDTPPSGWTVSNINESGTWDTVNKKVKWGPFFDDTTRTFRYNAVPPAGTSGTKTFNGIFSHDGVNDAINAQIEKAVPLFISGYVRTSGGTGISGVFMEGLPGSPTTNASGYYDTSISIGFSGTVTPSKSGYTFSPPSRTYTNVNSDQTDQNYTGTSTYTISGYVRTSGGAGISGVTMGGLGTSTNASGFYTATVNSGWSGTVTPSKSGYTFSPPSRPYTNVNSNQADQNYTGTPTAPTTYVISGYVRTSGGTGISGVTMGGLGTSTNASGFYTATVNSGWSETVTPSKSGYTFSPPSKPYTNVNSNQTDNYTGTPTAPTTYVISGYVRTSGGAGISGVTMVGLGTATNASGFYTATVNSGWSRTVTPSLAGYTFNPPSNTYNNVTADYINQNYTGMLNTYTISGYVKTSDGDGIGSVIMVGLGTSTNASGFYTATVNSGWSGTVTPSLAGFTFSPPSNTYTNVTADHMNQNYTGTLKTYTISGYVKTSGDTGISGVTMSGLTGSVKTDTNGYYTAMVDHGWSGTVVPNKVGYNFTPPSRSYTNVTADKEIQNYEGVLQGPTDLYVPSEYATIQAAINVAFDGDTVIVTEGTYSGDGNRDLNLLGKSITVKSNTGDPNSCILDCGGTEAEPHRGFYFHSDEDPNSMVEGFTIINGLTGLEGGSGIYCENSSPTIKSCSLRDNTTTGNGGGIACIQANPVIERSTISGNTASRGGGVYGRESDIVLDRCTLEDNWASPASSSGKGGGIYIEDSSNLTVSRSKLLANSADSSGGGIYCEDDSFIVMLSSLLNGNLSPSEGGAVCCKDSDGIIVNCTMNGNVASLYGGAVRTQGVTVLDIYNSIFWGNVVTHTQEASDEIALSSESTANIDFTDVEGGPPAVFVETGGTLNWGSTNININPQFMNPGYWLANEDVWIKGSYNLLPTSPCVDTGDNAVVAGMETDIVGSTRILGGIVDLGAYEYAGGLASSVINMKKMKVKAGKVRESEEGLFSDSFTITGYFGADVNSFESADTVNITIGPWTETINRTDFVKKGKKSKYQYKGPPGGITAMKLDFDKGVFVITGKKCNLTGLTAPVSVIFTFGDFYGYTVVAESVINGNKQLPVQFLTSYTDFLRVDKIACKSGEDTHIAFLSIQGAITALDNIDLTVTGLIIDWGAGQYEIAKENFKKKNNKYTATIPSSDSDPSSAKISIDFDKSVFKIILKNTSIVYQVSPVLFALECGSFDYGVEVTFEGN